jgi:hypothetical protein
VIIFIFINSPLNSADYDTIWGNEKNIFLTGCKPDKYLMFKAKDDPDFKNRIIDFFTSMSSGNHIDITVIRINGKPEIDYCFFNNKLYSVSENWGEIDKGTAEKIIQSIRKEYSAQGTEKRDSGVLYSFKKNKTKIVYQQNISGSGSVRVTVFYYSTDLFRMLFNGQ